MPQQIWGFPNNGYMDAGNMPYTVYCVNLTSQATDLIVEELTNTTPFTYTWTRTGAGQYEVVASVNQAFVKASCQIGSSTTYDTIFSAGFDNAPTLKKIYVATYNLAGSNTQDNQLDRTFFEIRIYP